MDSPRLANKYAAGGVARDSKPGTSNQASSRCGGQDGSEIDWGLMRGKGGRLQNLGITVLLDNIQRANHSATDVSSY